MIRISGSENTLDDHKIMYRMLEYLRANLDTEDVDYSPISAERLGISKPRWAAYVTMLAENGLIKGVTVLDYKGAGAQVVDFVPRITLQGLDYLSENTWMKKAARVAKGIKDIIPGT